MPIILGYVARRYVPVELSRATTIVRVQRHSQTQQDRASSERMSHDPAGNLVELA